MTGYFMKSRFYFLPVLILLFSAFSLLSEPSGKRPKKDPRKFEKIIHEDSRTLAVLPLANETGDERVDYLRTGILKMMRNDLEEIGQITVEDPEVRFVARPYPHKKNRKSYAGGRNRLPLKVRILQLNSDLEELYFMSDSVKQAEYLNADYILSGSFTGDPVGMLELNFHLFDARNLESRSFQYKIHVQEIYKSLAPVSEDIKKIFATNEFATVTVETPVEGAMAYLDDVYLGRTPVTKKIFPDRYTLYVEQDGYVNHEETVTLQSGKSYNLKIQNKKVDHKGLLAVTSDPPGADVYLNITKIGKTPLVRDDLPEGTHRIRISMDGYIDRFIGITISRKKSVSFSVQLKEGDTYRHFRDPHYVVLDWTYDELSFATMLSSLAFYGGYWSYTVHADRIRDSIRREIPFIGITDIQSLTLYQFYRLEKNNQKALSAEKSARASARGGIYVLLLSGAFLWRGLILEGRETGEVLNKKSYSFFISPRIDSDTFHLKNSGFDAGFMTRF